MHQLLTTFINFIHFITCHVFTQKKKVYIVDGNIGVGKSSILYALKNYDNVEVLEEPLRDWRFDGLIESNLLFHYYQDPKKYAFMFQTLAIVSRAHQMVTNFVQRKKVRFYERSLESDKYIFADYHYSIQNMTHLEYLVYKYIYDTLLFILPKRTPDGIFLIQADADTCIERIKVRDRYEESPVNMEYWSKIENNYKNYCDFIKSQSKCPIYIIDSKSHNVDECVDIIRRIIN